MSQKVWTGKDVIMTFGSIDKRFGSIEFKILSEKGTAKSTDSTVQQRYTRWLDAQITVKGFEDDATSGAGTFATVGGLALSKTALSALTFTDTAETPGSRLPAEFWASFPVTGWVVDEVDTTSNDSAQEWTAKLSPNNLDAVAA